MCGLTFSSTVSAQEIDTLRLDRLIIKGPGDDGGNDYPKSPVQPPVVALDGHTL